MTDYTSVEEISKPYKVLIFVLDKPLVSDAVIKATLLDLINSLIKASFLLPPDPYNKVILLKLLSSYRPDLGPQLR